MRRVAASAVASVLAATVLAVGPAPAASAAGPACPPSFDLGEVHPQSAVTASLVCDDPSGTGLVFEVTKDPDWGSAQIDDTGSVTYFPQGARLGPDAFQIMVFDNEGGSPATVQVTVEATDHAPVCEPVTMPAAARAGSSIAPLVCTDSDDQVLEYSIVTPPAQGTVVIEDGPVLHYFATPTTVGTQTFTFAARGMVNQSEPQTATVFVAPNGAPVCASSSTTSAGESVRLALTCADPDGDPLVLSVAAPPAAAAGSLGPLDQETRSVTFTPASGFSGTARVTYVAHDPSGATSAPAVAAVVVQQGESPSCAAARAALAKKLRALRKLKKADASAQRIARAKKKVRKAKQLVAAACG